MKTKTSILYGEYPWDSEWQTKTFKDEMSAVEFIRKNGDRIHGINGKLTWVKASHLSHFEIYDLLNNEDRD